MLDLRRWQRSSTPLLLTAIVLTSLAVTTARSLITPLYSSGDEMAHADYAYQVWQGRLPIFEEGLAIDPPWGTRPPVQWTAQHPPLFYLLLAPIVGPLTDAGMPLAAGLAGRALNTAITACLCVAVAWAASALETPTTRGRFSLVAAFLTASSFWVMGVGSAIYNDNLGALTITLAIGAALHILQRDPGRHVTALWLILAIASVAGSLTRLASIPFILIAVGVVGLRGLLSADRLSLRGDAARAVAIGIAMVAASGWFYLRNIRLTGSVTGGHPEWAQENTGRSTPPVLDVATDPVNWAKLLGVFSPQNTPEGPTLWLLLVVPAALGLLSLVTQAGAAGRRCLSPNVLYPLLLLLTATSLVLVMQFTYVSREAGNLFPRYSLPIILITAVLVSRGLTFQKHLAPVLVAGWGLVAWISIAFWFADQSWKTSTDGAPIAPQFALPLLIAAGFFAMASLALLTLRTAAPVEAAPPTRARPAADQG